MYGYNMATSYHIGASKLTVSPAATVVKTQVNSPMSPMTPSKKDVVVSNPATGVEMGNSKCKRKINFNQLGLPPKTHMPQTVARRNARERNRVKQVNNGFAALKQHIPLGHRSKKMSKVETLRCAVDYIKSLQGLLDHKGQLAHGSTSSNDNFTQQFNSLAASVHEMASHYSQLSPSSSEDPASPSYASEASYVTSTVMSSYDCENYEPVSPEDEELLDAISWWQQS